MTATTPPAAATAITTVESSLLLLELSSSLFPSDAVVTTDSVVVVASSVVVVVENAVVVVVAASVLVVAGDAVLVVVAASVLVVAGDAVLVVVAASVLVVVGDAVLVVVAASVLVVIVDASNTFATVTAGNELHVLRTVTVDESTIGDSDGLKCVNVTTRDVRVLVFTTPVGESLPEDTKPTLFELVCEASKPIPFIVSIAVSELRRDVDSITDGFAATTLATPVVEEPDQVLNTVTEASNDPTFEGER